MKLEAIIKVDKGDTDKLDCFFYTLITSVEKDNIKYAWLDITNNSIAPVWFDTIPDARKSLFDYFNNEYLFSIEFRKKEM